VKLAGRVAIVTGGASGIGRAIAQALAVEGATVAVADVNASGAADTVSTFAKAGGKGDPFAVDVTDVAAVERMVKEVAGRWGSASILVSAAGWDRPVRFVETTPEFWDRILAINLRGPIACTRAVLPGMIEKDYGKIVFISSEAGRVGSSGEAVYSAAKGGLIAFTKTIAREVARHHINVNCVCPGPSDTPLFQREFMAVNPKLADALRRLIPWGRLGTPEDVAPAVAFLVSDDSAFITGQTLSVSGGLTML